MGPDLVVSQGKSGQEKHRATPFLKAQVAIWHILFSLGRQPASSLGHFPCTMRGHASQAMPHTPIFIRLILAMILTAGHGLKQSLAVPQSP
jgi:hypothetical protein